MYSIDLPLYTRTSVITFLGLLRYSNCLDVILGKSQRPYWQFSKGWDQPRSHGTYLKIKKYKGKSNSKMNIFLQSDEW